MAIVVIYRSSEVDRETFDRFRVEAPLDPIPEGAISHLVTFDDQGLLVVDVWESQEALAGFAEARVYPALRRMGLTFVDPTVLEVHALWARGDAAKHNVAAPRPSVAA